MASRKRPARRTACPTPPEDGSIAGRQPLAAEELFQRSRSPDTEPPPVLQISTPRTGRKATQKTDRPVSSDDSEEREHSPPPKRGDVRMSCMRQLLERMINEEMRHLPGGRALASSSPHPSVPSIFEGSKGGQDWAGLSQGQAEDIVSMPGVPEEELLGVVGRYAAPPTTGMVLPPRMAATINRLSNNPLQDKAVQQALDNYIAPENCEALKVKTVNGQIWNQLGQHIRAQEVKMQRVLKLHSAAVTAFARSVGEEDLTIPQQDALALMCGTTYELNNLRRDNIRPALNPTYAGLCKAPAPERQALLFGADLPKRLKELEEAAKPVGLMRAGPGPSRAKTPSWPHASAATSRYRAGESLVTASHYPQCSFLERGPGRSRGKMRRPTAAPTRTTLGQTHRKRPHK